MSKETTKIEAVYDFKETAPAFFSDVLPNRIDFVGIVTVDGANPNGDPRIPAATASSPTSASSTKSATSSL